MDVLIFILAIEGLKLYESDWFGKNETLHSKNKNVKFEPKLVEFDLVPRNHSSN